jgi:hypothetical protein
VQKYAINFIKKNCTEVTKVEYFTDGCASQYKNYKTMLNLCKHGEDSLSFATSHGQSPCDGIGGTAKRSVTRYNLQEPAKNQIKSANAMLDFLIKQVSNIFYFYIEEEEIGKYRKRLNSRFEKGQLWLAQCVFTILSQSQNLLRK